MKTDFLNTIENAMKTSLFTDDDLKLVFKNKKSSAIYNSLTYHLKKNNLERYRRGLYSFSAKIRGKYDFTKFTLANKLVLHSFISYESALSHHGLIPEAVYEVTSACLTKGKSFKNVLGVFTFTYSPLDLFYLGVEKNEIVNAKIANPIRALFDLVYKKRIIYKELFDLERDLRVDLTELEKTLKDFEASSILKLGELYKKKTTRNLATLLVRDLM